MSHELEAPVPDFLDDASYQVLHALEAAGFREARAFRPPSSGTAAPVRALVIVLAAVDGRTDAVLTLLARTVEGGLERTARVLELVSRDAAGRRAVIWQATGIATGVRDEGLARNVPGPLDAGKLLATHELHLHESGFEPVALDPGTALERAIQDEAAGLSRAAGARPQGHPEASVAATIDQGGPAPAWAPALAPVEYGIAVGLAILAADFVSRCLVLADYLLAHGGAWGVASSFLIGALRDGALSGTALGLLAWRAERRGQLPARGVFFLAALAAHALGILSWMLPTPFVGGHANVDVVGLAVETPLLAACLAVGFRLALAAQGRWTEGLRLALPRALGSVVGYLVPLSRGWGRYGFVFLGALVGLVALAGLLPVFTRVVPRVFRSLGIFTRAERSPGEP